MTNLLKTVSLFVLTTIITACSGLTGDDEFNWRPYKDLDGSTQYVSFLEKTTAYVAENQTKKTTVSGEAIRQVQFGEVRSFEKLGDLYPLVDAKGTPVSFVFSSNEKSYNPHQKEDVKVLGNAKSFDFYEFGKGRLSHGVFSSSKGICDSFKVQSGVNLKMVTNYYLGKGKENYYTSLIDVNLGGNNPPKEIKYSPYFTGDNSKLLNKAKEMEAKAGKQLATANIKEKITILYNVICRK